MQDKNDFQTLDAFSKPSVGRPRTSTPDKKRFDAALRAKRCRDAKADKLLLLEGLDRELWSLFQSVNRIHSCFDDQGTVIAKFQPDVLSDLKLIQEDIIKLANRIDMDRYSLDYMSRCLHVLSTD